MIIDESQTGEIIEMAWKDENNCLNHLLSTLNCSFETDLRLLNEPTVINDH